ncbi:Formamidopyrimidine-DNA glycosylase [BD1-7 clade bacterium]|uniref:Formamidopyrimidine-DNA glycosylase n=1 Tax=BD1-7 clade bacterium TaxID=2029982 RepID=A0A5S9QEY5_9GAMM|nr:Formamidopyrimidine-DNA glycosylase [BD1-7 clade bacterium]
MPELPEVETSRRGIEPHIQGQAVVSVTVRQPKLRWPVPVDQLHAIQGQQLLRVGRRGKYLQLFFDSGYVLVHLGMSGSVRIVDAEALVGRHDHVDMAFANGCILRYHDPRRFGCWLFHPADDVEDHPLLMQLGPEPLSDEFTADYVFAASRGKTQAVKTFIMDSHVVVGVGNIYASESLFMAGIHPKRTAGNVSKQRYARLVEAVRAVLAKSIEDGGTTLRDFVGGDGKPGYFQQSLRVYGREGEPCRKCDKSIRKITLGQRSTFYCAQCQR